MKKNISEYFNKHFGEEVVVLLQYTLIVLLHIFEVGKKIVYYFGHEVQGCVFLEEHVFKILCKNADIIISLLYIEFQESCQSNYWLSFLKEKNATFLEDFAKMC